MHRTAVDFTRKLIGVCLAGIVITMPVFASCRPAVKPTAAPGPKNISELLQPILDEYKVPALAAIAISNGEIVGEGVVGVRKYGDTTLATIDDEFHLGSCAKAMTATMIAMLVEKGKLTWTATVADVFPEIADGILPQYSEVTLLHLLSHHAGLPGTGNNWPAGTTGVQWLDRSESIMEQRYLYTKGHLCEANPQAGDLPKPGTKFLYSNVGFVIAAAMAERATGTAWEELMAQYIFKPLGITTAGFGAMGTGENVDQPWQHSLYNGQIYPISPGTPRNDNPPALGPAGRIHMSIRDWAKFIIFHLEGEKGGTSLLRPETFKLMHTAPFGTECGLDWGISYNFLVDGIVFTHTGSNTLNYAQVLMSTERDFAVIVTTNIGGTDAGIACGDVVNKLITEFLPTK